MSLVEELEDIHRRLGRSIVLPTPAACKYLLERAQAAEIPIGTVYVLSRPLSPRVRGSYDRRSGDVWCHFDSGYDEGGREVLQCLLTLIAYVKLQFLPPTTIEEDWEQSRTAHQEAASLARAWEREDLFSASDLAQILSLDRHLYLCHIAAGELAGNFDPFLARVAYNVLLDVQQRHQWNNDQFVAALYGWRKDEEEANAAVLDFDRCSLRSHWLSISTRKQDEALASLGQWALPQTPRSARVLRSALQQVARHRAVNGKLRVPLQVADHTYLSFFHMNGEQDLSLVVEHVNAWLLEDFPECYARVRWSLYADIRWRETLTPSPHLYHMSVEYTNNHGNQHSDDGSGPIRREMWVFVPARERDEVIEAAWQRYLRSWLTFADLHTEDLFYGLQVLWSWLQQ